MAPRTRAHGSFGRYRLRLRPGTLIGMELAGMQLHEFARRDCCLPGIDVMPATAMIRRIETVNCSGPEIELNTGTARMGILARSIVAITIGIVFLIAMLFALAADLASGTETPRRQTATPSRRNRAVTVWS